MDRRTTLKWVAAASTIWPLVERHSAWAVVLRKSPVAHGYGTDPSLLKHYQPGELWPLSLTAEQRALTTVLADLIIPADDHSPSASAAGVVDFIDEWVSAPYESQQRDRQLVLDGLGWLERESQRQFGQGFALVSSVQRISLCDNVRNVATAAPALQSAARSFALLRDLVAGGFYSSPAGRKDLNYIGNVPLTHFDGAPAALLQTLGLP